MSNENKKIAFLTAAYNGEKTLQRTIDSIKAQTHQNFEYFILNDGSSDSTQDIIDKNCRLDPRIHSIYFEKNDCQEHFIAAIKEILLRDDFDYFAICDHDDEYLPEFAEKTIEASIRTGAEAVFCEIIYYSPGNGGSSNKHFEGEQFLSSDKDFANAYAPYLCALMRSQWAKLFSIKAIRKTNLEVIKLVKYGRDTIFCNEIVKNCTSIMLIPEPLYRFYISDGSETSRVEKERITAPTKLFHCAENFVKTKCGEYQNLCLEFVYMNYLSDTYFVTNQLYADKNLSDSEKIEFLIDIYSDPNFDNTVRLPGIKNIYSHLNGLKLTLELIAENAAQKCLQFFPSVSDDLREKFASVATYTAVLSGYKNPMFPEMGNGPKAAVFTLCRGGGEPLKKIADSVLLQTYWNFDYFLIDNEKTEKSSEFAKKDPRVHRIIYKENITPDLYKDVIPKILQNSEYKFFAVCNEGEELFPKFLETAVKNSGDQNAILELK